ncbi:unnamed protein product [Strongylus vulgaris]|uniref:Uncharacterized protein n=1 Tax=Strongylus vulgaris TaxID=40348 RepID=A0A3P7IQA7_STRVU|nr:unnamed protein product [Strongylus vulgaris]
MPLICDNVVYGRVVVTCCGVLQPSVEADSDDESTDYDDVFAAALSAPSCSQQNIVGTTSLTARRASTSSSAVSEAEEASDSDSDSQRSRHRAVELVDAAAGYASVQNVDEAISSSDDPKEGVKAAFFTSEHSQTLKNESINNDADQERADGQEQKVDQEQDSQQQEEEQQQPLQQDSYAVPVAAMNLSTMQKATEPTSSPIDEETEKAARGISDVQVGKANLVNCVVFVLCCYGVACHVFASRYIVFSISDMNRFLSK